MRIEGAGSKRRHWLHSSRQFRDARLGIKVMWQSVGLVNFCRPNQELPVVVVAAHATRVTAVEYDCLEPI